MVKVAKKDSEEFISNKLRNSKENLELYKREVEFYKDQLKDHIEKSNDSSKNSVITKVYKKKKVSSRSEKDSSESDISEEDSGPSEKKKKIVSAGKIGLGLLGVAGIAAGAYKLAKSSGFLDKVKAAIIERNAPNSVVPTNVAPVVAPTNVVQSSSVSTVATPSSIFASIPGGWV